MIDHQKNSLFLKKLQQYSQILAANRHRQLLLITGKADWSYQQAQLIIDCFSESKCILSKTEQLAEAKWPEHNHQILGQEYQLALYDGYSGLLPDKLAALSGTVKAGGLLILIQPELSQLAQFLDPAFDTFQSVGIASEHSQFNQKLARLLTQQNCIRLDEKSGWTIPDITKTAPLAGQKQYSQQAQAVTAIVKTATGRANRPLLITADRGRGKSSALGLAAAELNKLNKKVVICTAQRNAVNSAFKHLQQQLDLTSDYKNQLANMTFMPPDKLLAEKVEADVVFIDEAAALPVPVLKQILNHYPRVVLATTIYGYEGTGRGFTLRFIPFLQKYYKNWKQISLDQPIRYASADPLEADINQLLCLQADCAVINKLQPAETRMVELKQTELVTNDNLLQQLFGLLVLAHYQTTVNDLRHLLDGNQLRIFVTLCGDKVIATALVAIEGNLASELALEVLSGTRRPKGHLLAQSLSQLNMQSDFLTHTVARVVRIAVHPKLTRQQYGLNLLNFIEQTLKTEVDVIGASFGGYANLLAFWHTAGYQAVKLGFKKDKISGEHACLVVKGLNKPNKVKLQQLQHHFSQQFPLYLLHSFKQLDAELVMQLFKQFQSFTEFSQQDLEFTQYFINNQLNFEHCYPYIFRLIWQQTEAVCQCDTTSQQLLISLFLQNHTTTSVQQDMAFTGHKQLMYRTKQALVQLLNFILDGIQT